MLEDDDPTLEPKLREVTSEMQKLNAAKVDAESEAMRLTGRLSGLGRERHDLESQLEKVKDVGNHKVQALRRIMQNNNNSGQGEMAYRARSWLLNNKDQFRQRVYEPIMLTLNVNDPADAIYLENCVAARDLVALAAEVRC